MRIKKKGKEKRIKRIYRESVENKKNTYRENKRL